MMLVRWFIDRTDLFVLTAISIFSICLAVLDFFGLVSRVAVFQDFDFSKAALLLLGVIGLQVAITAFRTRTFQEHLPNALDRVVESLNGVFLRTFRDAAEQDSYIAKRILEAESEVCDLSWKSRLGRSFGVGRRVNASDSIEKSISKASAKVAYREIFVFSDPRRFERMKRRINENKAGYSCRYYASRDEIPRLQFVIIDRREIIFASSSYPKLCAISHPYMCEIFQAYFDEAWDRATSIKEGALIDRAILKRIENEMSA